MNYTYGIYHWRILRSSYWKLTLVRFETMTNEFRSDLLTNRAIRPWVQLTLRASFVQLLQFHQLSSVTFHFGYNLSQSPCLFWFFIYIYIWWIQISWKEWKILGDWMKWETLAAHHNLRNFSNLNYILRHWFFEPWLFYRLIINTLIIHCRKQFILIIKIYFFSDYDGFISTRNNLNIILAIRYRF